MPTESLLWAFCRFGIVDYGFYRKGNQGDGSKHHDSQEHGQRR